MTVKELRDMNKEQIESRIAALDAEVAGLEAGEATEDNIAKINAAADEKRMLQARQKELEEIETRTKMATQIAAGAAQGNPVETRELGAPQESVIEKRAKQLVETGRMEMRQLLSTSTLRPDAVKQEIGELPNTISSIVDDVNAFELSGNGAWTYAYRDTDGVAEAVTEGSQIGGTPGTFKTGKIEPSTWGILDEISNQVKLFTPLAYEASVRNNSYLALRRYAKRQIVKAILGSDLVDKKEDVEINADTLREIVLGFNADETVAGGTKLYLSKETLIKFGKLRGDSEKKPLYEITFTDENNGHIKEGGMDVPFSILSDLAADHATIDEIQEGATDIMIYGQMGSVDMPLWGGYSIETDEGGDYFKRNMMGIRGLQTAGVGVTKKHTVLVINNKVNP